ncbi:MULTISPECIES: hypothetical protein [Halostella]|uniref:DUF7533 family protein n=1 Tax=Halostella TaxID=1843185 RepID=UPI0010802939|nr:MULTISPECIES: hypothetical protein [Halostella]
MSRGIIDTLQLGATLLFAIPIAYVGADFLFSGRTLFGAGFLAIAVLMVLAEEYLTTPGDLTGKAAEKAVGAVAKDEDE